MNTKPTVFLVDDDDAVRDSLRLLLKSAGFAVQTFCSAEEFLDAYPPGQPGCLILDLSMPGMQGTDLQVEMQRRHLGLPIIFLTGYGDIPTTVRAIQAGAVDFLTKPVPTPKLLERVQFALEQDALRRERRPPNAEVCLARLTPRELQVATLLAEGFSNKLIGRRLGISFRTAETHRARIMEKTGAANLIELVEMLKSHTTSEPKTANTPPGSEHR